MKLVTFSSGSLWQVAVSLAAYTSIVAVAVLWIRVSRMERSLRRSPVLPAASSTVQTPGPSSVSGAPPVGTTGAGADMAAVVKAWGTEDGALDPGPEQVGGADLAARGPLPLSATQRPADPVVHESLVEEPPLQRASPDPTKVRQIDLRERSAELGPSKQPPGRRALGAFNASRDEPRGSEHPQAGINPRAWEGPRVGERRLAGSRAQRTEVDRVSARLVVDAGAFQGGSGAGQDQIGIRLAPAGAWWSFAVLSDGAGGTGNGLVAASTAVAAFSQSLEKSLEGRPSPQDAESPPEQFAEAIWAAAQQAHLQTRKLSRDPLLRGSCATLDAVLLLPTAGGRSHVAVVVHVGDGAVWALDGGTGLRRESQRERVGGATSAALGAEVELSGDVLWIPAVTGQFLALSSDGFESGLRGEGSDEFALASMAGAALVRERASASAIAKCLGGMASERPVDDVSVVVIGVPDTSHR